MFGVLSSIEKSTKLQCCRVFTHPQMLCTENFLYIIFFYLKASILETIVGVLWIFDKVLLIEVIYI